MPSVSSIKSFERSFEAKGLKYNINVISRKPQEFVFDCIAVNNNGKVKDGFGVMAKNLDLPDYVAVMYDIINKMQKACTDNKLIEDLTDAIFDLEKIIKQIVNIKNNESPNKIKLLLKSIDFRALRYELYFYRTNNLPFLIISNTDSTKLHECHTGCFDCVRIERMGCICIPDCNFGFLNS